MRRFGSNLVTLIVFKSQILSYRDVAAYAVAIILLGT